MTLFCLVPLQKFSANFLLFNIMQFIPLFKPAAKTLNNISPSVKPWQVLQYLFFSKLYCVPHVWPWHTDQAVVLIQEEIKERINIYIYIYFLTVLSLYSYRDIIQLVPNLPLLYWAQIFYFSPILFNIPLDT